ncbi:MAG: hypothetical protein J6T92_08360 [Ottowia sp.]|nr:hypothetical protein [Ottowia sp.]
MFRSGTGGDGAIIRALSGGRFSYVGIVAQVAPRVLIVLAGTGEEPKRANQVQLVTWEAFASRSRRCIAQRCC